MLRTKKVERIVCVTTALMLLSAACLWGLVEPAQGDGSHTVGYEKLLFDQNAVHTIDITMADWDSFIANATAEEYTQCDIVIDGEKYDNVAIRAKGNTSLSSVASMGSTRYSFKVEFDHYVKGMTYHGLDKLSLNNLIQDATMMKDYLAYTLMGRMDVPSSLCSYVQISVNGQPWGLYLAVEGVEEAFLDRNGMSKGELYKPDSMSFGGGRGRGQDFSFDQFREKSGAESDNSGDGAPSARDMTPQAGNSDDSFGGSSGAPAGMPEMPQGDFNPSGGANGQKATSAPGVAGETDGENAQGQRDVPQMAQGSFDPFGGASEQKATPTPDAIGGTDGKNAQGQRDVPGMPGGGGFNFGMGNDDVKLVYSDDDPDSYSNIFNNAKTDVSKKDKARLIEALRKLNAREDLENTVQQDEVIRYLVVHQFLCNDDSYTGMMVHNYYLYEEGGKLSIIPWDYNLAFGGFSAASNATSTVNSPIDSPVSGGTVDSRPLIAWIFSDQDALADYHAAYDRFIEETVESGWLAEEIDRVREMITPYLEQDTSAFYDMEEFEQAVNTLKTFCQKRGESIRGQLDGTIPSTSQGQQENSAALVDASDISIVDMGSMNTGKNDGGGFQRPGNAPDSFGDGGFTPPSGATGAPEQGDSNSFGGSAGSSQEGVQADQPEGPPTQPAGTGPAAANQEAERTKPSEKPSTQPTGTATPDGGQESPDLQNGFPKDGMPSDFSRADQSGRWIQLAIWSAVLLAAVLIVRRAGSHNN